MGLSLEFYAGDADSIGVDFTAIEFECLRDGRRARAYADFSLHLSPTDLDIFSEVVAQRLGTKPLRLNEQLTRSVGGSENESGADLVDPAWVQMVAGCDDSAASELTEEWINRVGANCGLELAVTLDAVRAVEDLIHLCQLAKRANLDVVHTWYL
jgi:hypothetical protein